MSDIYGYVNIHNIRDDIGILNSFIIGKLEYNIKRLKNFCRLNKFVFIPNEPWEHFQHRYNVTASFLRNNIIICSSSEQNQFGNLFMLPTWHLHRCKYFIDTLYDINNFEYTPQKKFITLIGKDTIYRRLWYNFIEKFLHKSYYNFAYRHKNNLKKTSRFPLCSEYFKTQWEFGIETSSYSEMKFYKFITEKTWRPFLLAKPNLVLGYPGMYKRIAKLGVTLNPYINYDFDNDTSDRFDKFCIEVERLLAVKDMNPFYNHAKLNQYEVYEIIDNTPMFCPLTAMHLDHKLQKIWDRWQKIDNARYIDLYHNKVF